MLNIRPDVSVIDPKVFYNLGACLDIPTGCFTKGKYGENILNGGAGTVTGVVGGPNQFKSTIMWYMVFMVLARYNRILSGSYKGQAYDTEINISPNRLRHLISLIHDFIEDVMDIVESGDLVITDAVGQLGDIWFDKYRDFLELKHKQRNALLMTTPIIDAVTKELIKVLLPTTTSVDSFSEFATTDVVTMQEDNVLGAGGGNMIQMRQGANKNRFMQEIPKLAAKVNEMVFLVGHTGDIFELDPRKPSRKKLQYLPQGMKIKGVPEKFAYLTNNCWWCHSSAAMINQSTKAVEFPKNRFDDAKGNTDLNLVKLINLRGKNGQTGFPLELVVSQTDGVLPTLTEFNFLKDHANRYGFEGNVQNYNIVLSPDHKLSRTVVRTKIDDNEDLRRAINITSEIAQMQMLWPSMGAEYMQPMEVYAKALTDLGYNIPELLKTRGWWTFDNDKQKVPFLSSMDFLEMATGRYIPYWMGTPPQAAVEKNKAYKASL